MCRIRICIALLLPVLIFSIGSGVSAQGDMDCPDFASQEEAQAYFNAGGGSPAYNFNNLDADHDGYACENHFGYIGAPVVTQPDLDDPVAEEPTDVVPEPGTEQPVPTDPVTELPDTGVGSPTGQIDTSMGILSAGIVLAGLFLAVRVRPAMD